jgi:hypothetical protein
MRAAPAVSCAMCTRRCAHEHTGSAEAIRHSLRDGFTVSFVLSPVTGFVATVAREKLASHELDASVGASGPHDFTVRFSAVRQRHIHVHHTLPRVVTIASRPSWWDRIGESVAVICPTAKAEYFSKEGWIRISQKAASDLPVGQSC